MGNCFTHHKTRLFITKSQLLEIFPKMNVLPLRHQRCTISIFRYQFNINYSVCRLININTNINYFKGGLSISIPYQFFQKFPYQFQYQFMLSISPYDIVNITNCLSISHCYQYQYWYQLMKKGHININSISIIRKSSSQCQYQYQYCHFYLSIFPYQCIVHLLKTPFYIYKISCEFVPSCND